MFSKISSKQISALLFIYLAFLSFGIALFVNKLVQKRKKEIIFVRI